MPYLIFALFVALNPVLTKAADITSCFFMFGEQAVAPIPEPILMNPGLEDLEEGARVVTRGHAFGTTHFVLETNALRLREMLETGEISRELVVTTEGLVTFTYWEKKYRNTAFILPEQAQALIAQLRHSLDRGGWSVEASDLYRSLQAYVPAIAVKTKESSLCDRSSRQPVPWRQLNRTVGRELPHAFGTLRLVFDVENNHVFWHSIDKAHEQIELITLCSDGTATRQVGDEPAVVAHMDAHIAGGISNHAYHNTALGGCYFENALRSFREFVLADVPELFVNELPYRNARTVEVETDYGIVPFLLDSRPKPYNPDLGVDQ